MTDFQSVKVQVPTTGLDFLYSEVCYALARAFCHLNHQAHSVLSKPYGNLFLTNLDPSAE